MKYIRDGDKGWTPYLCKFLFFLFFSIFLNNKNCLFVCDGFFCFRCLPTHFSSVPVSKSFYSVFLTVCLSLILSPFIFSSFFSFLSTHKRADISIFLSLSTRSNLPSSRPQNENLRTRRFLSPFYSFDFFQCESWSRHHYEITHMPGLVSRSIIRLVRMSLLLLTTGRVGISQVEHKMTMQNN